MVDLDACYFCGDIGETLRRHDVLPPEIAPSAETQRTVVLCHRCHRKLQTVVEPLVDAIDEQGPATSSDDDTAEPNVATAEPAGRDPVADEYDDETPPATTPAVGVGTDAHSESEPGDTDEPTADPVGPDAGVDAADVPDSDADESPATDPVGGDSPEDETGVAIPNPGGDEAAGRSEERAAATAEADASSGSEGASDEGPTDGEETGGDEGDTGSAGRERPAGYHKTLRFLRNRNLPMPRSEAEELVASAYDVDVAQCRRVLDVAVEEGVLAEDGGQIRRA